ncbi:MAG TPA: site-2 protease family protein [Acidimicrobiales bacterium]|nr:site-2 protease family protein [Acidimicrobiales bacterium]
MSRNRALVAALVAVLIYLVLRRHVISGTDALFYAVLVPSIILHEVSHGAVALAFGDDTAQRAGRLTLNPISHIDLFGTIILPAMLVLTTGRAFGYAKPVPVNVTRLRSPRNQGLVVSLAGPAVNIVIAVLSALALRFVAPPGVLNALGFEGGPVGWRLVFLAGYANVLLAAFNLIPIPPLDGSAVVERLLPRSWWPGYLQLRQYALGLVLLLVLLVPSALNRVFDPALHLWARLLT